MILHIINRNDSQLIQTVLDTRTGAAQFLSILLLSDAAYLANNEIFSGEHRADIYVLEDDVLARGLTAFMPDNISIIDYDRFVSLVIEHDQSISW
jgi:sulfur relay protein TusB/DsrH